jgi:hypothetical protein
LNAAPSATSPWQVQVMYEGFVERG